MFNSHSQFGLDLDDHCSCTLRRREPREELHKYAVGLCTGVVIPFFISGGAWLRSDLRWCMHVPEGDPVLAYIELVGPVLDMGVVTWVLHAFWVGFVGFAPPRAQCERMYSLTPVKPTV